MKARMILWLAGWLVLGLAVLAVAALPELWLPGWWSLVYLPFLLWFILYPRRWLYLRYAKHFARRAQELRARREQDRPTPL